MTMISSTNNGTATADLRSLAQRSERQKEPVPLPNLETLRIKAKAVSKWGDPLKSGPYTDYAFFIDWDKASMYAHRATTKHLKAASHQYVLLPKEISTRNRLFSEIIKNRRGNQIRKAWSIDSERKEEKIRKGSNKMDDSWMILSDSLLIDWLCPVTQTQTRSRARGIRRAASHLHGSGVKWVLSNHL
ncbi:uncharacterized protein I303_105595 [Kwoniella dejecticola CBS 10117]|uniref:Uncharacterized protein n=1 Tax=Kwoniella dejecticola CBS 10117 TaxID=1296121 RepID=A0A1A6A218_9TREE|nr:uncharacterized protein I303_04962 [Kwoniella dejecticola CBS 10117]OBR84105.1 hypothetical protein I303_04962 [Kwoniella dejecticola CBS 10117]